MLGLKLNHVSKRGHFSEWSANGPPGRSSGATLAHTPKQNMLVYNAR